MVTEARPVLRRIGVRATTDGRHLYWWAELSAVLVFYFVYSLIRNASEGDAAAAFDHARQVINWERALGIYVEETLQDYVLLLRPLVVVLNYLYGSLHFIITGATLIFLFRRSADHYRFWRNTLAVTTALALIGFVLWPLMPPRLLPDGYGFVDTLRMYPTIWSFQSDTMNEISNQYAAMPSLHFAWALLCAFALAGRLRHPVMRRVVWVYPLVTLAAIVLTGNHYVLDAVVGALVFAVGFAVSRLVARRWSTPAVADNG